MSFFVDDSTKKFFYKGEEFEIKELGYGEVNQINKKALKINFVTKQPEMDLAVLQEEKMKASLVSWTLKDKQGNLVPITIENIRRLKEDVAQKILQEIDAYNETPAEEKKE